VRCVHFEKCLFDPIALVRFQGYRDLREVAVGSCVANGILESIEDVRAGIPRRVPDGIGDVDEVVGRILRSLRALRLVSIADPLENELMKACAKSLQFIEIKTTEDWCMSFYHFLRLVEAERIDCKVPLSFCLDIGACSKLRSITVEGTLSKTLTISNLVLLLSTLRNPPKLSRIRVFAGNFTFLDFVVRSSSHLEVWRQLDKVLCELCPQPQKEGDGPGLTFQVASRKFQFPVVHGGRLLELLPKFSRIGACEEVEV
jgi:hypothetical protein